MRRRRAPRPPRDIAWAWLALFELRELPCFHFPFKENPMKKIFAALLMVVALLGAFALVAPPVAQAKDCIICPQIAINCGACGTLVPQTCSRCAYCKQIPGCHT